MKRLFFALTVLLIVSGFFLPPALALSTPVPAGTPARQAEPLRVGLVLNSGGSVDDGGFNQSAYEALLRLETEMDATIAFTPSLDVADYATNIAFYADQSYNVIVTIGFDMAESTAEAAALYPDTHFIGVDQFQGADLPNLTGLIFPEDEAGFLAGVLAAGLTQTNVVRGVFGAAIPPVEAFHNGFISGVEWAAGELGKTIDVEGTFNPAGIEVAFAQPSWGRDTAGFMLNEENADVIFAAAGETGNGALIETASTTSDDFPRFCIGVDTDQWFTVPEARPCLASSAQKLITDGVVSLVQAYVDGTIPSGNFLGDVALADFHDFDSAVPDEIKDLLQRAETGLKTNSILTCHNLDLTGLRIGLVTDVGYLRDGGFNESTWNGVLQAERCGAEVDFIETQDTADYATNITEFAEQGFNIIIVVGFNLQEATLAAAQAYPDIHFFGVDHFYEEPYLPNATALIFAEDQAGFLAGVLAARLSQSKVVAAVLGSDIIAPVVAFKEGFELGVQYADPEILVISTYHPGGVPEAFEDPQWGATTARQALDQGADVVFAAAGRTGNGALLEVAAATTPDVPLFCIGVDTDQWLTVPEAQPCLVSSAQKILDGGIASMIVAYHNGTLAGGNFKWVVGLASFHDFEAVIPTDVQAELSSLATALATGQLETGYGQ